MHNRIQTEASAHSHEIVILVCAGVALLYLARGNYYRLGYRLRR